HRAPPALPCYRWSIRRRSRVLQAVPPLLDFMRVVILVLNFVGDTHHVNRRNGIVLFAALALLTSCTTIRQTPEERDAMKTLEQYLQLDRSGARLDPVRLHSAAAFVTWKDEPTWQSFAVITGWELGSPQLSNGKLPSRVGFYIEGVVDGDAFFPADSDDAKAAKTIEENKDVTFVLTKTNDGWRIESPRMLPHAGFPAAKRAVNELGAE